ncbi:di-trans,poly-cis-decaprenylcistransferase [Paenibacillus mesophilus]|uniref:polyprenyl diphosphate synthase n=1 Tax=Paenibacillus mesophilus TaxID=2582849 RepID=UPI00110E7388|nr:polyprenyl diphosphate synthase [Paenibacillus mesophilus]TMV50121.1 di-trans,poly-cis-decaprenylcistransferase [Paenibacillus mesophilus]
MNLRSLADAIKTKKLKQAIDWNGALPSHIAIMMDGNGRWAARRGLPRSAGHYAGMQTMRETIRNCLHANVKYLTLYAFSTENWKRPAEEVDYIINLVHQFVTGNTIREINDSNIRIRFIGDISRFSDSTQQVMKNAAAVTGANTGMTVNFAMNYGGRSEIIHALKSVIDDGKEDLTPDEFETYLYTSGCPSPQLVIRTSGEKRLSGFLLWQCAQAELWFTDEMWPSFSELLLYRAIYDYQCRRRGFGS